MRGYHQISNGFILYHNGNRYEFNKEIKNISNPLKALFDSVPDGGIPQIQDNALPEVFETFVSLCNRQGNISFNPANASQLVGLILHFQVPSALIEYQNQIINIGNSDLIVQFLIECPDDFPILSEYVSQNLSLFANVQSLYMIPAVNLSQIMFRKPTQPVQTIRSEELCNILNTIIQNSNHNSPDLNDENEIKALKRKISLVDGDSESLTQKTLEFEKQSSELLKKINAQKKKIEQFQIDLENCNAAISKISEENVKMNNKYQALLIEQDNLV